MWTDASKQARYSGGGWVSACGAYDWFKYGSRAARRPIDFLAGDTVVACVERLAHKWRGCVVQFFIDNSSFQKSGAKGRSKAHRLNDLLRELLALMIKFGFVITWTWIATEENVDADHLSRGRVDEFLRTVYERGVWTSTTVPEPMPDIGRVRTLPEGRGNLAGGLAAEGRAQAAAAAEAAEAEVSSVCRRRSWNTMHGVMDNRLSSSSWRTVSAHGLDDLVHGLRFAPFTVGSVSSAPTTRAAAASWPPSSCT